MGGTKFARDCRELPCPLFEILHVHRHGVPLGPSRRYAIDKILISPTKELSVPH